MKRYLLKIEEIEYLVNNASPENLGDNFSRAITIYKEIPEGYYRQLSEIQLGELRSLAARSEFGWKLFETPILPTQELTDIKVLQLLNIERALHELCYCCERIEEAAAITWGGSTPSRFYLNSIYHYVSSMFLIDKSRESHKNLPMGGTVVKVLHPIGLDILLAPIIEILDKPFGDERNFGEAILLLRHSHLVHGDFSPANIEYLVKQTQMRDPKQQMRLSQLIWELFHQLILLNMQILAIFGVLNIDIDSFMIRYIQQLGEKSAYR